MEWSTPTENLFMHINTVWLTYRGERQHSSKLTVDRVKYIRESSKTVRELAYVNHIDGNKQNSNLENLEWSTPTENSIHAHKHGLANVARGERQHSSKLTVDRVKYIRESSKQLESYQ